MRRIAITPTDRFRRCVVVPDVAPNLSGKVSDRGEDAAREQIPFDLGKPELDLVEPRGIGRREMQPHVRMLEQEGAHGLGLMRREIVRDHVNLPPLGLAGHDVTEEFDKRGAGVSRHCLTEHLARLRVQRGEERQRAVAVVLEAMSLGSAGREWQHGIETVQRLNGRLLVDGKDRGVVGRIDVQADHLGGLQLEVGIIRLHVAFEAMRLKAGALPRFRHEVVMNLEHASQFPSTPVCAAIGRRLLRLRQNARFHRGRQDRRRLPAIPRPQAVHPIGQKATAPPIDVVAIARDRRFNSRVRVAIRQHQNHPRTARVFGSDLEAAYTAFELGSFIGRQRQRHMAPNSTSTASVSTSH